MIKTVTERFLSVLKIRNYLFLTLSGTISQLGDRLTHMLLITLVGVTNPGKIFAFSKASLAFTLPVLFLSPFVGVLADRWNKRKIMVFTHFIQTLLLLQAPFLLQKYQAHFYLLFIIILAIFFGLDIFNNTAKPALLPSIVAKRKLLTANSLDQLFTRVATVLGMVIGGFLIRWVGWRFGFIINAFTHFSAGLLALGITLTRQPLTVHQAPPISLVLKTSFENFLKDIWEVIRLLIKDRLILFVLGSVWITTFIAGVSYTILIFLIQQVLKMGTSGVGIFSGILALGMITGAFLMGLFKPQIDKKRVIIYGILFYGLLFSIGAFLIKVWFMIIVGLLGGVFFSWITIAQNTILQENIAPTIRGRIFSTKEFFTNTAFLFTTFIIGFLSDRTDFTKVLFVIGIILIALSFLSWIMIYSSKKTL